MGRQARRCLRGARRRTRCLLRPADPAQTRGPPRARRSRSLRPDRRRPVPDHRTTHPRRCRRRRSIPTLMASCDVAEGVLPRINPPKTRIGLVAGGLGAYWPQFPGLLPALQNSARRVCERLSGLDCEVVDVGFISDAREGAATAEKLRLADCDLIIGFLTTYMTATMLVPVAQRSGAPVLLLNLQPTESMDHATFDTGAWLAYCGACPLPEMANAFERCGVDFRSVSGYLEDSRAWVRIAGWIKAAGVRGT